MDTNRLPQVPSPATFGSAAPTVPLRKLAARLATLLSALPRQERLTARAELVSQVAQRQRPELPRRSSYAPDCVVGREIARIADTLAGAMAGTPPESQAGWDGFACAVNDYLARIEADCEEAITRWAEGRLDQAEGEGIRIR